MFSPTEEKVLKILGKKMLTIDELSDIYFHGSKEKPMDRNAVVSSAVRRINKKCQYHKLEWFINGVGLGRHGRTVWKDHH